MLIIIFLSIYWLDTPIASFNKNISKYVNGSPLVFNNILFAAPNPSNKNAKIVTTQRDYLAGITKKVSCFLKIFILHKFNSKA